MHDEEDRTYTVREVFSQASFRFALCGVFSLALCGVASALFS